MTPSSGRPRLFEPDGRVAVLPSLLAADHAALAAAAAAAGAAGARWVSVDVMDGLFVPNLSFGPGLVRSLRSRTRLLIEAHLMVADPARLAPAFADAGAGIVTFHVEACGRPRPLLRLLARRGVVPGLAVKPATPASAAAPFLEDAGVALVMTVEPGFGGQAFMRSMLPKVRELRGLIAGRGLRTRLMVDGGVDLRAAAEAAAAGADALVAGTSVFGVRDPAAAYRAISAAAQAAFTSAGWDRMVHGTGAPARQKGKIGRISGRLA